MSNPSWKQLARIIQAVADWLEALWASQGEWPPAHSEYAMGLADGGKNHRAGTLSILRRQAENAEAGE